MLKRSSSKLLWVAFVCSIYTGKGYAGSLQELSVAVQNQVLQGEMIAKFDESEGTAWPNCKAYQFVENVTPEQSAAVLFNYPQQKEFVHRVIQSDVVRELDPLTHVVDYSLGLNRILTRIFGTPHYSVRSTMEYHASNQSYHLHWSHIHSNFLNDIQGGASFEPVRNGTLIAYSNHMEPLEKYRFTHLSNPMIYFFHTQVIAGVKRGSREALESIVQRIRSEVIHSPHQLEKEIQSLRSALRR